MTALNADRLPVPHDDPSALIRIAGHSRVAPNQNRGEP